MFGEKKKKERRICIYNINAPHQNYLYVVFLCYFVHVFKVCIYADPRAVDEQRQR